MVNAEQINDILRVSYINEKGNIELEAIRIPQSEMFSWEPKQPDETKSIWYKKELSKKKTNFLNPLRKNEFLHSLPNDIQSKIFSSYDPKIYFCDIETEIIDEFPSPDNPKSRILTICLCNEKNDVLLLGLKEISQITINNITDKLNNYFKKFQHKITFKYEYFDDEILMLRTFFKYLQKIPLLTGWNFIKYDWAYITGRAKRLGLDASIVSPSNKLIGKDKIPLHKIIVDYLTVYKKWDQIVSGKESAGLDWVSERVLGLKKIKFKGSFMSLYQDNYEDYLYYNSVDTFLVRLIHQELNTLSVFLKLGQITHVEALKAISPVNMTTTIISSELLKTGRVIVKSDYENDEDDREDYEGAYVMPPVPGLYEYVATYDFASLYPSIIRQFNISPDTYVGKEIDETKRDEYIKTVNGCYFKKNEDGVLRVLLTDLFKQRKAAKKKSLIMKQEADYLEQYLKNKK